MRFVIAAYPVELALVAGDTIELPSALLAPAAKVKGVWNPGIVVAVTDRLVGGGDVWADGIVLIAIVVYKVDASSTVGGGGFA